MKILWVEDANCLEAFGGTAQNDRLILMEGIRRGYDIHIVTPQSIFMADFDLAILHNITMFNRDWLLKLVESKPYVIHFHDFPCRYRLYFPMLDKCKRCPDRNFWLTLLTKAKANFFLSPLHKWAISQIYPEIESIPYYLVPSAMNPEPFLKVESYKNRSGVIAVNSLYPFKGKDNVLDYAKKHPEIKFTFVGGKEDDVTLPPNCCYVGFKPHDTMPSLYAEHESFIHLPNSVDPFCQAAVEAYISGCRLIINKLVGCASWDWFNSREKVIENVSKSKDLFWDKIDEL
jgi:hypothetical protein